MVEGSSLKAEPSMEDDECDLPVGDEENRETSPATNFKTEESSRNVTPPKDDASEAPTAPSSGVNTRASCCDGVAEAKSPSGKFWFGKKSREMREAVNIGVLHDLDQRARKNEEIGTAGHGRGSNQEKTTRWWKFGGGKAQTNQKLDMNKLYREFREQEQTQETREAVNIGALHDVDQRAHNDEGISPSGRDGGANQQQTTPWWKFEGPSNEKPDLNERFRNFRCSVEQSIDTRVGDLETFRKMMEQRSVDGEAGNKAPRQPWWRSFGGNRPDAARNQASSDSESSTEINSHEAEPRPIAIFMKKTIAAVTGACMVVVGIPLLIFPIPGPGVAMITSGVYVISTEFNFARGWLEKIQTGFAAVFDRIGIEFGAADALPAPAVGSSPVSTLQPSSSSPAEADEPGDVKAKESSREEEIIMRNDDDGKEIINVEENEPLERKEAMMVRAALSSDKVDKEEYQ